MRNTEEIIDALRGHVENWWQFNGTEKSASQTFLNQLIECFTGQPDVFAAGATFEQFGSRAKGSGYMDLYWEDVCIIEMKSPKEAKRLEKHRDQAIDYWRNSSDPKKGIPAPRFLVLCGFTRFEVWEPGRFPNAPRDTFSIEELPDHYGSLLFLAGREPVVGGPGEKVSQEAAQDLAGLYFKMLDRGASDRATLRRFILQTTWCLFAEDLGLLPSRPIERLARALRRDLSRSSALELGGLYYALDIPDQTARDATGFDELPHVNGGLFANPARVLLNAEELDLLVAVAAYDWRHVNPTIFGSLMESCLGHDRRWELGAHFTYEQDIMSIVEPTISRPWRDRIDAAKTPAAVDAVVDGLVSFKVLDPACGCGNFLAIAYRELRHLTAQALDKRERVYKAAGAKPPEQYVYYPLSNVYGLELEEFAVDIARVTLWMTHKVVTDEYGLGEPVLPLVELEHISTADALEVDWPEVDAIIGNPPFHGDRHLRRLFGDDYVEWLKQTFGCGVKDYCVYWFRKAHDHLGPNQRAGLVGTNSVSQNRARSASLEYIIEKGGVITDAISTQDWPGDAAVDVSLVNWINTPEEPVSFTLDGVPASGITSALRDGTTEEVNAVLAPNKAICFYGPIPIGKGFVLSEEEAEDLLADPSAAYSDVVRRYLVGKDIVSTPAMEPQRWTIDFGLRTLEEAMKYPRALQIVRDRVKPVRDLNKRKTYRERWWLFGEPIPGMRRALEPLGRFAAANMQGKRMMLVWCEPTWCPSNLTAVFAFDDDYHFGVLSSAIFDAWARHQSSTLEDRLRYTLSSAFDTFPFPPPGTSSAPEVAECASNVVKLRVEHCRDQEIGLTTLYNRLVDGAYPDLARAHQALDRAVCAAYGWPSSALNDNAEMAARLHKLNEEIAAGLVPYEPFA